MRRTPRCKSVLKVLYHCAKIGGARISAAAGAAKNGEFVFVGPIANLKGHYFQPSLSVCLCVSDGHFYPSMLTDFDETWSQAP